MIQPDTLVSSLVQHISSHLKHLLLLLSCRKSMLLKNLLTFEYPRHVTITEGHKSVRMQLYSLLYILCERCWSLIWKSEKEVHINRSICRTQYRYYLFKWQIAWCASYGFKHLCVKILHTDRESVEMALGECYPVLFCKVARMTLNCYLWILNGWEKRKQMVVYLLENGCRHCRRTSTSEMYLAYWATFIEIGSHHVYLLVYSIYVLCYRIACAWHDVRVTSAVMAQALAERHVEIEGYQLSSFAI